MSENEADVTRLLVVSRDPAILRPLWSMGESNGWQLEIAADPWEAIDRAQTGESLDLLLLDFPQGSGDGLHSLRWLRRLRPNMPIILIGHANDHGKKQESIRLGARDFLTRPIDERHFEMVVRRNISMASEFGEADIASDDVEAISDDSFFIGVSPIMRKLRAHAALLAETDVPVLILGEDGSGKETTARLVHSLSVRSGFEFAKVNCAALPGDLLERELFGSERRGGNMPGGIKTGKLELCEKGTIFLDEITEMPPGLQANLLKLLQNKRFVRPGSQEFVDADVRVVAASSVSIDRAISEHRLSEDLYHQLSAYTIHVPSLRDRKEELSFLSRHFMHRLSKHYGLSPRQFSPEIIQAWQEYNWPGNLKELEHCVKRYLMVGDEELAFSKTLANRVKDAQGANPSRGRIASQAAPASSRPRTNGSHSKSLRSLVQNVKAEAEKNAIAMALEKTGWNRKAAARLLKVSYRTVLYKIEQYQMTASDSAAFHRSNEFLTKAAPESEDRSNQRMQEGSLLSAAERGRFES